jgi:hypothetical protein
VAVLSVLVTLAAALGPRGSIVGQTTYQAAE